ncbi:MAG TPA: hypothetical protein DIC34_10565 [Treponema sp.]|nr:hypothetical protein [Treponema sp.]
MTERSARSTRPRSPALPAPAAPMQPAEKAAGGKPAAATRSKSSCRFRFRPSSPTEFTFVEAPSALARTGTG